VKIDLGPREALYLGRLLRNEERRLREQARTEPAVAEAQQDLVARLLVKLDLA